MADPNKYAQFLRDPDQQALDEFNRIEAQGQRPWYQTALPMEGRATFLPFRDTLEGSVFNQRELALPGIVAGAVNAFTAPERARTGSDVTFNPNEEALNFAQNVMGGGIGTSAAMKAPMGQGGKDLALNAYHGTPHEIKGGFDISKVGTGEGAQAYGHGMYFAENPDVAKSYQTSLAADRGFSFDGKSGLSRKEVQDLVNKKYGTGYLDGVIRPSGVADSFIDDMVTGITRPEGSYPRQYKSGSERAKIYDELRGQITHASPGNLYKVDIPDEIIPNMINWDAPLSKQPENVQKFFTKRGWDDESFDIYNFLKNEGDPAEVAKLLQANGITGIRYLDEGSRSAGKGTSNFVVFDPKTVKILEKNDVPVDRKELLQEQFDKLSK